MRKQVNKHYYKTQEQQSFITIQCNTLMRGGGGALKSTHKEKANHRQTTLNILKTFHKVEFYRHSFVRKHYIPISLLMLQNTSSFWGRAQLYLQILSSLSFSPFPSLSLCIVEYILLKNISDVTVMQT